MTDNIRDQARAVLTAIDQAQAVGVMPARPDGTYRRVIADLLAALDTAEAERDRLADRLRLHGGDVASMVAANGELEDERDAAREEAEQARATIARVEALARDLQHHGDLTPSGHRALHQVLRGEQ